VINLSEHQFEKKLIAPAPHINTKVTTDKIMADVIIALLPATFLGIYFFGIRAGLVIFISVISAVLAEWLYQKLTKQNITIWDLSAVLTGLLLGMNLPVSVPIWIPIVGSFFAIIVVKQLFGGLGQNFMNPALAARALLLASYPVEMTTWAAPIENIFSINVDAITAATPLALLSEGFSPEMDDYIAAFIGNIGGSIGETSAIALLIGGAYLLYKKVITWHTPFAYIATVYSLTFFIGRNVAFTGYPLYEVLAGGLLLGAIFMATDYSSSPIKTDGKLIMGIGCGIITVIIRIFGGYPEGVTYAILLMNLAVPLIDKYSHMASKQ